MSGIQEILLIAVIILILFIIPRMPTSGRPDRVMRSVRIFPAVNLSGHMRLAIVISVIWPVGCAAWLRPWEGPLFPFLYLGLCPVAAAWGFAWVIRGFKKFRR
ncbi:MAG: hypothetical protein PHP23_15745 [Desulfobacterales bacterium]|nr:hypothetical protein [Desulfobacterales bacterium]MDD4073252.1 hypothetical protein [Desulfobacterales bacterium]MDD4391761.1 hypothetical protein [Desulfobacterales bacterium]